MVPMTTLDPRSHAGGAMPLLMLGVSKSLAGGVLSGLRYLALPKLRHPPR